MSGLAGAAADTLEALGYGADGEGAVDVIGYHTGTFIAAELAIVRPDLVRRLVLPGIPFRLLDRYMALKDNKNSEKLSQEIDNIEIEYSDVQNALHLLKQCCTPAKQNRKSNISICS